MKQPTTEQTQYIEPIGFKGTRRKWQPNYNNKAIVNGDDTLDSVNICSIVGHPDHEETAANRKIISQSKELAKALQDEVAFLEEWNGNGNYSKRIKKIKQVLKDAGLE